MAADGKIVWMSEAVKAYEAQMRPRAKQAVVTSRDAAWDGHSYAKVADEGSSALLGEKEV